MATGEPSDWVEFGSISRPHGVRGEVRLVPIHRASELPESKQLRLRWGETARVLEVAHIRAVNGAWLVQFAEVGDRDAAAALAGARVDVAKASLPPLEPGEIYFYELVGARAESPTGELLGTIEQLVDNGGQDLLVLASDAGERLVPLGDETLVHFDRDRRVVVLRIPEGLFE